MEQRNIEYANHCLTESVVLDIDEATTNPEITCLDYHNENLKDQGAITIMIALQGTKFTHRNYWGEYWDETIDYNLKDTWITRLNLSENNITDVGAVPIITGLKNTPIVSLNLNKNNITDDGACGIANALKHTRITTLCLTGNEIGDRGAIAIGNVLKDTKITRLELERNNITQQGAIAIARGLKYTSMTALLLGYNRIGSQAAIALANILKHTPITHLYLENCSIGDQGAAAIANSLKDTQIIHLRLKGNHLKKEGLLAIAQVLKKRQITSLVLDPAMEKQHNIEYWLKSNQLEMDKLYQGFENFVSMRTDCLEFIITNDETEPLCYMDFTKIILTQRANYISNFLSNGGIPYRIDVIKYFVVNIETKLAEFFSKLDYTCTDHVKLLILCEEQGIGGVVEKLLEHRPNYLLEGSDILHPTVQILMHKYGIPFYFEEMKPTRKDLIAIWESSDWDHLIEDKNKLLEILK